ncbi:hypothetical protein BY458DRAFT_498477 [Sporodiniella umbellata]|nr:hypothetical protein BY458DRAFT_498477 [Sporodiniella umbellata]
MRFSLLALATVMIVKSTDAAWSFQIYENAGYAGKTLYYTGKSPVQTCHEIDVRLDNKASSFHYGTSCCHIKLYDGHGCSGAVLGSSTGDWNVRQISNENNDRLSSFHIDCRKELAACI